MNATGKRSNMRLFVAAILIAAVGGGIVALRFAIKKARHAAQISAAYGRLCQMRMVVQDYERAQESLPPLFLRDARGRPIQSWRAIVFPYWTASLQSLKQLDLSQPWDSADNRRIIDKAPQVEWGLFARDIAPDDPPHANHLFAWTGADSLWDAKTGLPKGTIREHPDAVLLISVPESSIHPLEPRDLSEEQVRALVEAGQEVLFVRAGGDWDYGLVKLDHGRLVFENHREE
jgi:hypothetical protein